MSDPYRRPEKDLAYGNDYRQQDRGYGDVQYGQSQGQGQEGDRGIIGDTFRKFRSRYDQYQGGRPQGDHGYGSSSTIDSQQQYAGGSYGGGTSSNAGQYGSAPQSGQSNYPATYSSQPQRKPDLADKLIGGLLGSVTSVADDVGRIIGGGKTSGRPSQSIAPTYQGQPQGITQPSAQAQHHMNRFDSTFPGPRQGNDVKWYVDGCGYMWAVSQALERAQQTVWILDWWLSPELYLRRPPAKNEEWRIDRVLQRAADRGVKVNIIVYKEVTQALTLSSSYTKHALEGLSPNIAVFRHPDHTPDAQTYQSSITSAFQGLKLDASGMSKLGSDALKGLYGVSDDIILYWAHHEKLCLIDGQTAFMGGLDLCYGRWDTNQHPIADAHPSDLNKIIFPGQDFNDARVMDFSEVNHPFQNKLDRTKGCRMGWSDISICLRGPCVGDLIHHFVDRWNFIYDEKYNVRSDKRYQRLPPFPGHSADEGPVNRPQTAANVGSVSANQTSQQGQSGYQQPAWQSGQSQQTGSYTAQAPSQAAQAYTPSGGQQAPYQQGPQLGADIPPSNQLGSQQYNQGVPPPLSNPYSGTPPNQYQNAPPQPGHHSVNIGYQPHDPAPYNQAQPLSQQDTRPHTPQNQQAYIQASGNTPVSPAVPYSSTQAGQYGQNLPGVGTTMPGATSMPQSDGSHFSQPPSSQQANTVSNQYTAYTEPHYDQSYVGPAGPSGPSELSTAQSPPATGYHPYSGQPTARGMEGDSFQENFSGSRGLDDDEFSQDRAFGRKPKPDIGRPDDPGRVSGNYSGRPGGFRQDFMRLKQEGQNILHDPRKFGNQMQGKVSDFTGGRFGRPSTFYGNINCQLVRSCTKWSNGTPTEHSIQNAYIDLINNAKHFIYIENQFFITATGDEQKPVKNLIGKALVDRILRAARAREPFKVIVNIPSIPAFAGDLEDDSSLGTRAIMEFQYNSICRGGHSIMELIANAGINPMDYIRFYNLRNYDRINVTPAQQQAEQQSGVGYDEARRQYENQLGGGYAGHGEQRALANPGAPPNNPQYQQQQNINLTGSPQAQNMQHGQQNMTTGINQQGITQAQYDPQHGNFPPPPSGPAPGSNGLSSQYQGGPQIQSPNQRPGQQYTPQSQYTPPIQSSSYQPSSTYGQYQQTSTTPQFAPPPASSSQLQPGYGGQQAPPAAANYQQAAQQVPHTQADDWDSVSSCYMLGGQDIRNVPWTGPPEAELHAFVSEELYIHSKLMIVDDQSVICGSANLNDRSMLGTHDSEIAMIIQDYDLVDSTMAGRPWQASRFGASLRRQIFRKHLGLLPPQDAQRPDDNFMPIGTPNKYDWGSPEDRIVSDPLSDPFQALWNTRARTNTEVFRKAFRAVPDDNIRDWSEYKEFYEYYFAKKRNAPSLIEYGHVVPEDFPGGVRELKELLSKVKGTLVEMPLCFLQNVDLAKTGLQFNSVTAEVYT